MIVLAGVFCFLRVGLLYQFLFFGIVLAWTFWVYSYLHDRMRIKGFWMERAPILRHWFCWARRLHDIRHSALNDRGLMDKNIGIGFAFFDWLFGTMASVRPPFDHAGLEVARQRFDFVTRSQRQLHAAAKASQSKSELGAANEFTFVLSSRVVPRTLRCALCSERTGEMVRAKRLESWPGHRSNRSQHEASWRRIRQRHR